MTILICRKDYEALPEGAPYELHDGALVKQPSPRYGHQRVQSTILMVLQRLLGPARAIPGPVDVLVDELNVFAPDIVVVDDIPDDDAPYVGVPRLVIEVLSPSTRERDRNYKVRRLLGLGVHEVWLVDRHEQSIEVFDLEGVRTAQGDAAIASRAVGGFVLSPVGLFAT